MHFADAGIQQCSYNYYHMGILWPFESGNMADAAQKHIAAEIRIPWRLIWRLLKNLTISDYAD